jgi:Ca2+-binding RTX toxin-like protein
VPTGTLSALPQGTITVNAAVSNAAGTAASPATASFIKDTVAPTITITTPIGGDGYVNKNETNAALAISGTTSGASNGRPVAVVVGGVSYATTVNNNAWSVSVSSTALKALSDGTIGVTASVSDEAGNTGSQASSFILDTVAPTTAPTVNPSTTAPSSLAVLSGTATVPEGGCLVVTVNGANYSPVAVTDGTWTLNLASATPSSGSLGSFLDGSSYTVTATVCDAAGNGTSGTGTLAVSTPTPNTPTVNPLTTGLANGKPSSPITGGVQLRSGEKLTVSVSDGTTTAIYDNVMPTSGSNWSINLSAIPTSGTLPTFVLGSSYNIIATVTSANGSLTATDTSSAELTIGAPAILGTLSAALTTNGAEDNGADGTISATPTVFTFTRTPATGVLAANLPELIASYTLGGTSLGGVDYAYPAGYNPITGKGTVTFAAGATTATLTLNTINNSIVNGSRSLNAYLVKPSDYTLATIYSAGALLVDNDGAAAPVSLPVVSINSTSLVEGIAGTTSTATLKLTLSQTYSQDVSVNWTTKSSPGGSLPNATATAGTDYVAASGTAVILANSTGANVNITINGDGTLEASENFYVQLTEATNATLSPTNATGTITILNNDASGQLIDNSASTTNSTITGTTFADTLIGGSGNNNISGGAGNDLLRGGMGADTLTGGTGSDTFEYTSFAQSTRGSATQDYIVSFDLGSDRIKLPSLPGSLFNAGAITATNLDAAITSVYADKNRALAGNQAMASGDAVLFSYKATGAVLATTYLMVAAGNSANSSSDLFLRMGTGLSGVAVGQVSTPFFTT